MAEVVLVAVEARLVLLLLLLLLPLELSLLLQLPPSLHLLIDLPLLLGSLGLGRGNLNCLSRRFQLLVPGCRLMFLAK